MVVIYKKELRLPSRNRIEKVIDLIYLLLLVVDFTIQIEESKFYGNVSFGEFLFISLLNSAYPW